LKKLNLDVLLQEEINKVNEKYDLNPPKQPSPNKTNQVVDEENNDNAIPLSQNFDIISQLVGNVTTQSIQKPLATQAINRNIEKSSFQSSENLKKRSIHETQSPSICNSNSKYDGKKSKLSSQTIRNLNRFAFTEKEDIPKKDVQFVVPAPPQNLQNTQSISKSQRSQSKVQFSQKALSSINDDDLNFDV
jgi:hypothetical protein